MHTVVEFVGQSAAQNLLALERQDIVGVLIGEDVNHHVLEGRNVLFGVGRVNRLVEMDRHFGAHKGRAALYVHGEFTELGNAPELGSLLFGLLFLSALALGKAKVAPRRNHNDEANDDGHLAPFLLSAFGCRCV